MKISRIFFLKKDKRKMLKVSVHKCILINTQNVLKIKFETSLFTKTKAVTKARSFTVATIQKDGIKYLFYQLKKKKKRDMKLP
jgi:hypothetical protein